MVRVDASRYHSSEAVKLRVDWTSETSRDSFGHVKVIIYSQGYYTERNLSFIQNIILGTLPYLFGMINEGKNWGSICPRNSVKAYVGHIFIERILGKDMWALCGPWVGWVMVRFTMEWTKSKSVIASVSMRRARGRSLPLTFNLHPSRR